jgi:hypothetical protein
MTNSGDNWDLVSSVPGKTGPLPTMPGFDIEDEAALLDRARRFYDEGIGAWEENRRMFTEDLDFAYNSEAMGQWDPVVLQNRRGKPSYTFNRCLQPINMVIADMRQTRPAGKVRPASDGASEPVAEIFGGLCRSIEQCSRADSTYKEQFKYAVAGGFGAWRIMPTYMEDDGDGAFDQVLRVINISNPQTVVWDPQCGDPCAGDANRCMVAERISDDVYDALYTNGEEGAPSRNSLNFSRDSYGWFTDQEVRIAEYFERVPREKWIAKMTDGTVVDYDADLKATEAHLDEHDITFEKNGANRIARDKSGKLMTRKTVVWKVLWMKMDGSNILEGPYYYDWKRIPVVRCPGRYVNIEGRRKFQSLIRHAKDAQRAYNSRASDMIERSALLPKAPYLVTETMIKGYENDWNQANVQSRPYLPYNVDPKAPEGGMPFRTTPLDLPQGAIALAQMSIQDIQATIGYFDPALGNAEDMNRVSGKALVQHTKRSDLGSFEFIDGFQSALQLTWEMLLDMIPTVMDSERVERIIGHDGVEKMITVNQSQEGSEDLINDLAKGKYDVEVTIGPSFQSARQEALDTLIAFSEALPNTAPMIADLLAKNIDTPDAMEMARRLRIPLIQQGLVQPTEEEKKSGAGKPTPAQIQQQQAQQLEQQLLQGKATKMTADAQIAQSRAQASPMETDKLKFETTGKHLANIKLAHEIGADKQQAATEAQSAQNDLQAQHQSNMADLAAQHVGNRQDLQQAAQQHAQAQAQAVNEHALEQEREQRRHEAEERRAHEKHAREMARTHEKHQLNMTHQKELGEQQVATAKALAAAKPKKAKKAE